MGPGVLWHRKSEGADPGPPKWGSSLLPSSLDTAVPSRVFSVPFPKATSYSASATSLHFSSLG